MKKNVVVFGGGTGMSTLLKGLKEFPINITSVVSVCDDGRSTGRLREEFHMPAVGDIRQVLVALSETEPLLEQVLNYRFETSSDLNGHPVGNLMLTALSNITGSLSDGIEGLSKVLNLKGEVLPFTEDNITLVAEMDDGTVIEGEHHITDCHKKIKKVFYKENPVICDKVIEAVNNADLIILSMGSLYTSIIPNLISKELIDVIDKSKAKIMYVCNMMTQPGETDDFKVSDHVHIINSYLGKRKLDVVVAHDGYIDEKIVKKYATEEQKDVVPLDQENLKEIEVISDNYVTVVNNVIRHDTIKLACSIFSYLI